MMNRKHKNKLYHINRGGDHLFYFILYGKRYYLHDYICNREDNSININVTNCGGWRLSNIEFIEDGNDTYIQYDLEIITI